VKFILFSAVCVACISGCAQTSSNSDPRTKTVLVPPVVLANADNPTLEIEYRRQLADCQASSLRKLSGNVQHQPSTRSQFVLLTQQVFANPFGSFQQGYQQGRQLRLQQQRAYLNSGGYQRSLQRQVYNDLVRSCIQQAGWTYQRRPI